MRVMFPIYWEILCFPDTEILFVVSDLVPPSHFVSSAQFAGLNRIPSAIGTTQPLRRVNQGVTSGYPGSSGPWLALNEPHQEIKERRKENQMIKMLHNDTVCGSSPANAVSDLLGARYVKILIFTSCLTSREQFACRAYCASYPPLLKTDGMNSGPPDVSQSGAQRQRSTGQRLKGWRYRWNPWRTQQRASGKTIETKTAL